MDKTSSIGGKPYRVTALIGHQDEFARLFGVSSANMPAIEGVRWFELAELGVIVHDKAQFLQLIPWPRIGSCLLEPVGEEPKKAKAA